MATADSSHPFERDPEVVTYPYVEGPPLTDSLVDAAEQILGVKLPGSYLDLMRRCNGGDLSADAFPTSRPTSWAQDHVGVRSIFGVTEPTGDELLDPPGLGNGILATPYMIREWGLPAGLVLLDGDGHTWTALDYRTCGPDGPPSVVWFDVELGDELQLAPSFERFINGLRPEAEFDLDE